MSFAVGLMSGTSIDGIDAALIEISGRSEGLKIKLCAWGIDPFPKGMKQRILKVSHPSSSASTAEICRLNFELGELFAKSVLKICRKAKVSPSRLAVIGSHGQTICHLGKEGTLQIGEPSVIAERTGVTTVADFRPRDIAAGGFGAPLIPYLHYLLFHHPKKNRAVHNIGGISNLTFIPRGAPLKKVIGFDTGPGNMVIDGLMSALCPGKFHYDHGGQMAAKGMVSLKLLKRLMEHPFILKKPPKTSGREEFGKSFVKQILLRGQALRLSHSDLMATATALTAFSIAENYRHFVFPRGLPDEMIVGGGGIHNQTLMRMIRSELAGIQVSIFDDYGIPSDAVEAIGFAVLAYQTLQGKPTNLPSVTGAKRAVVLGKIIPGKVKK